MSNVSTESNIASTQSTPEVPMTKYVFNVSHPALVVWLTELLPEFRTGGYYGDRNQAPVQFFWRDVEVRYCGPTDQPGGFDRHGQRVFLPRCNLAAYLDTEMKNEFNLHVRQLLNSYGISATSKDLNNFMHDVSRAIDGRLIQEAPGIFREVTAAPGRGTATVASNRAGPVKISAAQWAKAGNQIPASVLAARNVQAAPAPAINPDELDAKIARMEQLLAKLEQAGMKLD